MTVEKVLQVPSQSLGRWKNCLGDATALARGVCVQLAHKIGLVLSTPALTPSLEMICKFELFTDGS